MFKEEDFSDGEEKDNSDGGEKNSSDGETNDFPAKIPGHRRRRLFNDELINDLAGVKFCQIIKAKHCRFHSMAIIALAIVGESKPLKRQ